MTMVRRGNSGRRQKPTVELVPGVHGIRSRGVGRAYLVVEGDRVTLIDTGTRGNAGTILAAVASLGRRPTDIRRVVLTHWHPDHTGGLAALLDRTGAETMAHGLDAPLVRGAAAPPQSLGERLLAPLLGLFVPPALPARVDRELADGDEIGCLGGMRVVHTPGHTAGSISLFSRSRRLLFTGDAAMNLWGVRRHPAVQDATEAKRSLKRLASLDVDVALFGHGEPIARNAGRRFRELARKL